MIMMIGLLAKNAILIFEFARQLHAQEGDGLRSDYWGGRPVPAADYYDLAGLHPGCLLCR